MLDIRELIPEGKENKIDRHELLKRFVAFGAVDDKKRDANRDLMFWLHTIRKDTVVISTGSGYYRPGADDMEELEQYIAKEEHRIKETSDNIRYAKKYLADMKAGRL